MRKNYKTTFVDEEGYPVYPSRITGFLHICRKERLTYCLGCMKDIVKGQEYINFYSELMGGERIHLDCYDMGEEGSWIAIKQKYKKQWIVKLFKNKPRIIECITKDREGILK